MTGDELTTVYTTTHPADAEMVRLALAEEGLAAFIRGARAGAAVFSVSERAKKSVKIFLAYVAFPTDNANTNIWSRVFRSQRQREFGI